MLGDDLSRDVYCVLGMPIDAVDMPSVLHDIETSAAHKIPLFISTANLNFLVRNQSDLDFKETLCQSDLCTADGMPIVWLAWLLSIPIKSRIAGSDIFDALGAKFDSLAPLKIFFFGGDESVAVKACKALNRRLGGLRCVGSFYPGHGSVDQMSGDDMIQRINSSNADFLVVSLGAKKGQSWLWRNHGRLTIPIRSHLGAVINFQAGVVKRAPPLMRKLSLEWLWRIKEEPHLWRRYWEDGSTLVWLIFARIVPLAVRICLQRVKSSGKEKGLIIAQEQVDDSITISLCGFATANSVVQITDTLRSAVATGKKIVVDLSQTRGVDARFLGLLLMLRKRLAHFNQAVNCIGASQELTEIFRLNGVEFLLGHSQTIRCQTHNINVQST